MRIMKIPRIYADFNGMFESTRYVNRHAIALTTMGSLRELSNSGLVLKEGMKLIVYMDSDETEDIESDAEVYFSREYNQWYAELVGEIRDVPTQQMSFDDFKCVSCKTQLHTYIKENGLKIGDVCPNCGVLIHKAIEPPNGF